MTETEYKTTEIAVRVFSGEYNDEWIGTDPAHCLTCGGKGVMDDVAPSTRVEAL